MYITFLSCVKWSTNTSSAWYWLGLKSGYDDFTVLKKAIKHRTPDITSVSHVQSREYEKQCPFLLETLSPLKRKIPHCFQERLLNGNTNHKNRYKYNKTIAIYMYLHCTFLFFQSWQFLLSLCFTVVPHPRLEAFNVRHWYLNWRRPLNLQQRQIILEKMKLSFWTNG